MFTLEDFAKSSEEKFAIRCDTEEEATECCRWMDSVGKRWTWGKKYETDTKWGFEPSQHDIYYTNDGGWDYSNGNFETYLEEHGIEAVPWSLLVAEMVSDECCYSPEIDELFKNIDVI